jgi:hypothetical protein
VRAASVRIGEQRRADARDEIVDATSGERTRTASGPGGGGRPATRAHGTHPSARRTRAWTRSRESGSGPPAPADGSRLAPARPCAGPVAPRAAAGRRGRRGAAPQMSRSLHSSLNATGLASLRACPQSGFRCARLPTRPRGPRRGAERGSGRARESTFVVRTRSHAKTRPIGDRATEADARTRTAPRPARMRKVIE